MGMLATPDSLKGDPFTNNRSTVAKGTEQESHLMQSSLRGILFTSSNTNLEDESHRQSEAKHGD